MTLDQAWGWVGALRVGRLVFASAVVSLALLSGCRVGPQDIEEWKGTVKGPKKLAAVVLADKYSNDLRAQAAAALVEMDRSDVDGQEKLVEVLRRVPPQQRERIIEGLATKIADGLKNAPVGELAEDDEEGQAKKRMAIRLKDAGHVLYPMATEAAKQPLTKAVLDWYVQDFAGRNLAGKFSAEQVIRNFGAAGAQYLVEALHTKLPQQTLVQIAQLINELGSPQTKTLAGQKLVAIETEMEGPEFLGWVEKEIQRQMSAGQGEGKAPDMKRIQQAAVLSREGFITTGALPAMKFFSDQPAVSKRLVEIAETAKGDPQSVERRTMALAALRGDSSKEHTAALLRLALAADTPPALKDAAFDRLGETHSQQVVSAMWPFVASGKDARMRWRAGELVLSSGGAGVLTEFFEKLASAGSAFGRDELAGYAARIGQISPLPYTQMSGKLKSSRWWERVVAVQFLDRKGTAADVNAVAALVDDKAAVSGPEWGAGATVGDVAKESLRSLKQRVGAEGSK